MNYMPCHPERSGELALSLPKGPMQFAGAIGAACKLHRFFRQSQGRFFADRTTVQDDKQRPAGAAR